MDLLRRCQVTNVHIPLDGIGATNDATRRLVGGGPTYDRIIENLGWLKPPIKTLIRANTHDGNVGQTDELKQPYSIGPKRQEPCSTSMPHPSST